jgi:hypothetical protein
MKHNRTSLAIAQASSARLQNTAVVHGDALWQVAAFVPRVF